MDWSLRERMGCVGVGVGGASQEKGARPGLGEQGEKWGKMLRLPPLRRWGGAGSARGEECLRSLTGFLEQQQQQWQQRQGRRRSRRREGCGPGHGGPGVGVGPGGGLWATLRAPIGWAGEQVPEGLRLLAGSC